MVFTEISFAIFMVLVFALYWALRGCLRIQNSLLLAVSYLFYAWWDWRFLGLIVFTSCFTYYTARLTSATGAKRWMILNVVLNLAILCVLKYFNFFGENLARLFQLFGFGLDWVTLDILLPVGVSFYTFQALGYSIDVWKRRIPPCHSLLDFCTYIAFFPQLVAGPIESASALLPQISSARKWDYAYAVSGMRMVLWGLFKKLCIADVIGQLVDNTYHSLESGTCGMGSILGWCFVAIGFTLQIYCDFSAYSEIARGVARLLGIELMKNFATPYFSRNPNEFWRRWHISLMNWFRDYVYIPLGGNRLGTRRTALNIMTVFLLSGLWHGASWNFVLWGLYWGLVSIAWRRVGQSNHHDCASMSQLGFIGINMLFVVMGWVIFRCTKLSIIEEALPKALLPSATLILFVLVFYWLMSLMRPTWRYACYAMATPALACALVMSPYYGFLILRLYPFIFAAIMLAVEWQARKNDYALEHMSTKPVVRMSVYSALILAICISESSGNTFIYFQF